MTDLGNALPLSFLLKILVRKFCRHLIEIPDKYSFFLTQSSIMYGASSLSAYYKPSYYGWSNIKRKDTLTRPFPAIFVLSPILGKPSLQE